MKFTIDTKTKTISINEVENLGEFFEQIKIMLPNDEWKNYKIIQEYFSYPVYPVYPYQPKTEPYITYYISQSPNYTLKQ